MQVSDFATIRRELDFSSSGQGKFNATQVVANGVTLINSVELLDVSGFVAQLLVCEACGVTGCEPGSWVAIRRSGDHVLFVPWLEGMDGGEWESANYSPPKYMAEAGPLVFDSDAFAELQRSSGEFPSLTEIPEINSLEVLSCIQLTAPGFVLGPVGRPAKLDADNIVAVTEGDLEEEIAEFSTLVSAVNDGVENSHSESPIRITEFHLDIPTFPAWRPFGYTKDGVAVLNLSGLVGTPPSARPST
ncbi:MAG: hypothetical protein AAGA44_07840 [Pseudomonadota bacterium]